MIEVGKVCIVEDGEKMDPNQQSARACPQCRGNTQFFPQNNDFYCYTCQNYLSQMSAPQVAPMPGAPMPPAGPAPMQYGGPGPMAPAGPAPMQYGGPGPMAPAGPTPVQYGGPGPMQYGGGPGPMTGGGAAGGELPNFEGTKKGLMIVLVGLIIQLIGPFMAIASPFVANAISFAGTAIVLLGMFMVFFAIKRGEINIPDTRRMVTISIVLIVIGLVMYAIGFIFVQAAQEAYDEYDEASEEEDQVEHLKDAADADLFGGILTYVGRLLSFMAPALTMMGIRNACFDEYQGKIMTKAMIAIALMIIAIVAVVGAILMLRAAIYELDDDSSSEDIVDAYEAAINAMGAICIGFLLLFIAYIFIMWTTTTTYHGLKQVEGEHKRRAAGW